MLKSLKAKLFNRIDVSSRNKFYPFILCAILSICSLIFATPRFNTFNPHSFAWETIILKSNDLTNTLSHIDPGSWLSKKVFRLTVPLIIKVCKLSPLSVIGIQYVLGYLTLIISFFLCLRITKDKICSTLTVTGLAFIYFGRAAFYDVQFLWFDGFAYFFLLAAMYSTNAISICVLSLCAAWTDERGFIALSVLLIYHQIYNKLSSAKFSDLILLNKRSSAVGVAIVSYLIIRYFLSYNYNMHTNSVGVNASVLKNTITYLPLGVWTFFEGLWIIYFYALSKAIKSNQFLIASIFVIIAVAFIILSGSVTDITRSGSYMVPAIFLAIAYSITISDLPDLRNKLFVAASICMLFPALIVCPDWGWRDSFSLLFDLNRHI